MADGDDEYFLPLEDQRVFGAGIKRKRVAFVPSSTPESPFETHSTKAATTSSHDIYLSVIQKKRDPDVQDADAHDLNVTSSVEARRSLCPICHLPLSASDPNPSTGSTSNTVRISHESSIAHQVCLTHSHPPSHLDREHVGMRYLSNYGWDPDSRMGLGAKGEGIRAPIKGRIKNDTSGLGVDSMSGGKMQKQNQPVIRLDAKKVREQEAFEKKQMAKLRDAFYGKDLEQYLGPS